MRQGGEGLGEGVRMPITTSWGGGRSTTRSSRDEVDDPTPGKVKFRRGAGCPRLSSQD